MFESIAAWFGMDWQSSIEYITNGKHMAWYASVRFTILAAIFGAFFALIFGLIGAALRQSRWMLLRGAGVVYTNMLRGIPDVLFLLFFPLAFEQLFEYFYAFSQCTSEQMANITSWPPCQEAQWTLSTTEYMIMACVSLGLVYGAFVANVIYGAMQAVPNGQLEAGQAFGFTNRQVFWRIQVRQTWIYALPGLSNVWMLLLKATSLLSLLQIADIVLWADRLGAPNYVAALGPVHGDWRWRYFLVLFIFYIILTFLSELLFSAIKRRVGRGMIEEAA